MAQSSAASLASVTLIVSIGFLFYICGSVHRKSILLYTGCPRRNVPDFGRVFLMLKYTDITQNTYVQS